MRISKKVLWLSLPIALMFCVFLINHFFKVNITGHFEGLYLLRDTENGRYDIRDHLFVGQEKKLIYALDLKNSTFWMARRLFPEHRGGQSHLHVEWNPWNGSGLVSNHLPDGTGLVTYLGRYLDDDIEVRGLFVGGGLPETVRNNSNYNMNNSGMTYFDGKRWFHIWCSVNEGIGSPETGESLTPSKWEFIGSGVEKRTDEDVIITSSHGVVVSSQPLRIDRKMHFMAGQPYFTLEIRITNIGNAPVFYNYLYGDEPWVGYYGTSLGDVGWVKDRLVNYEENIDPKKYSYIGMADIGNRVIGEQRIYTNLANFIEWFGPEQPVDAYFTNNLNRLPEREKADPLDSNERFLGIIWERVLAPRENATIRLAIGMAMINPVTGRPEKPSTAWK